MKRIIRNILIGLAGLILIWSVFTGVSIWSFGNRDHARKSDCIIVLGAAAYGAKPSPVFEQRIRHAITLWNEGKAPAIIFTGGRGKDATHTESEVGALFTIGEGVDKAAILTETTRENLVEAKALMDGSGMDSAIIVSDPLHLMRASAMASDLGMKVVTSPTPTSAYRTLRTRLGFLLREIYFNNHYAVTGK